VTRPGAFQCGCQITQHTTLRDREGYLICAVHFLRAYGWRTPLKTGASGQRVIDYSQMRQPYVPDGVFIPIKALPPPGNSVDQEELGRAIIARRNGK
jgi:hypothetical protein